jgi:prolyl-tRNA editing enzyme YbaK/EbsC (Cys-tRNA(Pro) deacylase)
VPFGYENILHVLANHRVPLNIKYHEPVSSPREVARLLQVDESALIKTILLRIEPDPAPDGRMTPPATYWAAALQATRKVDIAKVSELLNVKRGRVLIADTHELEEVTGFSVGGVPPFGYPRTIGVLLDRRVHDLERVYTGTGKPTESLRIAVTDLRRLASYTWADISK